jgi:hypothetical protein
MSDEGNFLYGLPGHLPPSTVCGRWRILGFSLSNLGLLLELRHEDGKRSVVREMVPSWNAKNRLMKLELSNWVFCEASVSDFLEEGLTQIDAEDIEISGSIWNDGIAHVV